MQNLEYTGDPEVERLAAIRSDELPQNEFSMGETINGEWYSLHSLAILKGQHHTLQPYE